MSYTLSSQQLIYLPYMVRYLYIRHHLHHCAAIVSRGWAKASTCCFHICLSCPLLCQMVPSSSRVFRLANVSPVFLYVFSFCRMSRGCDTQCPSVISYPVDVRCPDPLPASDVFNRVRDLCIFSYPYVCFSVPVCDV